MTQFLKNILVIFTIILMTANGTNAQPPVAEPQLVLAPSNPYTKIDHSTMRCQYRQTIVNDPRNPEKSTRENIMLLQIGKDVSRYSDIKKIMGDSLMLALEKQGADNNTIVRKLLPLERGRSSEVILKNYPKGKITFTNYLMASYLYEEVYQSPNWKLGQDTTTILGYPCRLATTNFRGRNYRAWFAPDIPVDDGPWKLRGLPGLILKATDDKNEVSFECISIEKLVGKMISISQTRTWVTSEPLNRPMKSWCVIFKRTRPDTSSLFCKLNYRQVQSGKGPTTPSS